ncbi:hypothetical protein J5X84_25760 [Streptosporangiaceae bacterium NEAU-GS5]|nr:hypothetical protein [Streptosporangiaceae bacterium NEAU-GS5]
MAVLAHPAQRTVEGTPADMGERARRLLVPLATTEGTLVAGYNRGMRLLTESGGVRASMFFPTSGLAHGRFVFVARCPKSQKDATLLREHLDRIALPAYGAILEYLEKIKPVRRR